MFLVVEFQNLCIDIHVNYSEFRTNINRDVKKKRKSLDGPRQINIYHQYFVKKSTQTYVQGKILI